MIEIVIFIVIAIVLAVFSKIGQVSKGGSMSIDQLEPRPSRVIDAPTRPPGVGPAPSPIQGRAAASPKGGRSPSGMARQASPTAAPPRGLEGGAASRKGTAVTTESKGRAARAQRAKAAATAAEAMPYSNQRPDDTEGGETDPSRFVEGLRDSNLEALRRAFVLSEVLGPPVAGRDYEDRFS